MNIFDALLKDDFEYVKKSINSGNWNHPVCGIDASEIVFFKKRPNYELVEYFITIFNQVGFIPPATMCIKLDARLKNGDFDYDWKLKDLIQKLCLYRLSVGSNVLNAYSPRPAL